MSHRRLVGLLLSLMVVQCVCMNSSTKIFEPVEKNRCEIKLVADYSFFKRIGNSNYANAARYLANLVERVNAIYTSIDWGISANGRRFVNMGFVIKEMKILDTPSTDIHHFNSEISPRGDGTFSSSEMLKSFSKEEGTSSTCLTVLVTAKVYDAATLGLANVGKAGISGMCKREKDSNGGYANTAILTVRRRSDLMITRVVDLVFAHEMGHLWGALHDPDTECNTPDLINGRYIMHDSSNSGYDQNNYKFSPCSIRSIHRLLYEVAEHCFISEKTSLCGNGILEPGEECDPGGQLSLGHPDTSDPCCTATCKLRPTAKCSPRHSECCSATCSYLSRTTMCQPKNTDNCKRASYCTGISDKCPDSRPVDDGTVCVDEGRCRGGECISFCQILSPAWAPCTCENVTESCLRCCRAPETGVCMPVTPRRNLPEGSICIQGQCHNNVCVKEATDAAAQLWRIIKDIGTNPSPQYFAKYMVFIVIFASLLIWCPCGFYIIYRDKQKRQTTENAAAAPQADVYIVPARKRIRRATATGN